MKNKDYDETILLSDDLREIIKHVLLKNLYFPLLEDTTVIDSLNNDQFLALCREINKALKDKKNDTAKMILGYCYGIDDQS